MKSQKGQSTVELALSMMVLLLILFGITDFGRVFHAYLTLEHASREAARLASVGGDNSEIIQKAKDAAASLDLSQLTISITPTDSSKRVRGSTVSVQLEYQIDFLTPLIQPVFPDPFSLKNQAVMRVE
ncbi:MAG: pilus assembly protein [Bacillaceae bacterium]|nr:pilus assembly protein [Bacillaceae bacterium]